MYSSLKYENIIKRFKRQLEITNRIAKKEDRMAELLSVGLEEDGLEYDKISLRKDLLEVCKASYNTAEEFAKIIESLGDGKQRIAATDILEDVYDIGVEIIDNAVKVTVPQLRHRESPYIHRIPYEKLLIEKLKEVKEKHNLKTIDESVIIFEHITPEYRIRDNDNYDTYETKEIIDAIVTSEIIKNDTGTNCFIMHITKTTKNENYTNVYVIERDKFSCFFEQL